MLSGLVLEAYCVWFRLAANCKPLATFPLCIGLSIVPAIASISFARNVYYKGLCFALWAAYCLFCGYMVVTSEQLNGVCWRERAGDVDTEIGLVVVTLWFAVAIVAVTIASWTFVLAKNFYEGSRRHYGREV